jgi:hypothetical protein
MDELIKKYVERTATEQEVSTIRDYLMTDKNIKYCYDIIFKMRGYTMKRLKIEGDCIESKRYNHENRKTE